MVSSTTRVAETWVGDLVVVVVMVVLDKAFKMNNLGVEICVIREPCGQIK